MSPFLSLQVAINVCRSDEAARANERSLSGQSAIQNKRSRAEHPQAKNTKECGACGRFAHPSGTKCPASGRSCHACGKLAPKCPCRDKGKGSGSETGSGGAGGGGAASSSSGSKSKVGRITIGVVTT